MTVDQEPGWSGYLTPEAAGKAWSCPLTRTFAGDLQSGCRGPECSLWRWKPQLTSDPEFLPAIKREMICLAQDYNASLAEGQKPKRPGDFHKSAVAAVMRNPEGFGIVREEGYCGLGGPVT